MKGLWILLIIVLIALLAVFVGLPLYSDNGAVAGTVLPLEPPGFAANGDTGPVTGRLVPDPTAPLPRELILLKPIVFTVPGKDRWHGHVRAQAGIHVELLEERGEEIVVRLVNATVLIPRSAVAPVEPFAFESSPPSFSQSARATGQRIVDYWFTPAGR